MNILSTVSASVMSMKEGLAGGSLGCHWKSWGFTGLGCTLRTLVCAAWKAGSISSGAHRLRIFWNLSSCELCCLDESQCWYGACLCRTALWTETLDWKWKDFLGSLHEYYSLFQHYSLTLLLWSYNAVSDTGFFIVLRRYKFIKIKLLCVCFDPQITFLLT